MTRAFYNSKLFAKNAKKLFQANGVPDKFDQIFGPRRDSSAYKMAARLVRFQSPQFIEFKRILDICIKENSVNVEADTVLNGKPLMILNKKDISQVIVFPNLILDAVDDDKVTSVCWVLDVHVLNTFWNSYQEDINDGVKAQAWTVDGRAWKRIRKQLELSIATALTRYTDLPKYCNADKIRNIAVSIEEHLKPMSLIFADTPESYIDMYTGGPSSCMSVSKATDSSFKWLIDKYKHHPCSFFYYHPYTRGVYVKYKGTTAARTILYQLEDGKWQYGRVYASNDKFKEKFERALKAEGFTWTGDHTTHKYARDAMFEMPAFQQGSHHWLLSPYFDNMHDSMRATFNQANKMFIVKCGVPQADKNIPWNNQSGVYAHVNLETGAGKCPSCRRRIDRPVAMQNGIVFCSSDCARANGYALCKDSARNNVWVLAANAYRDIFLGAWWTNKAACIANGGYPVIYHNREIDEEEHITIGGIVITNNGELYRLIVRAGEPSFAQLLAEGKIKGTGRGDKFGVEIYEFVEEEVRPKITVKTQKVVIIDDDDRLVAA